MNRNQKFLFLEAIAILLVVGGHTGVEVFCFLPCYSYHMMLFFFISGYFYKDRTLIGFLRHKAYHLLLPLLLWNIFYAILVQILRSWGLIGFGGDISFHNLFIEPFVFGHQYIFNLATWFVGALFFVQLTYLLLMKLFTEQRRFFLLGVLLLIALLSEYVGMQYELRPLIEMWHGGLLILLRTGYHLLFYHVGYLYRLYEGKDEFSLYHILGSSVVAGSIFYLTGGQTGVEVLGMRFHTRVLIFPIISTLAGIYLWVQIANVAQGYMEKCHVLQKIGSSTFLIMTHHLFFVWIVNLVLYGIFREFPALVPGFDVNKFLTDIYYRYPDMNMIYFLSGILGTLFAVFIYERISCMAKGYLSSFGLKE